MQSLVGWSDSVILLSGPLKLFDVVVIIAFWVIWNNRYSTLFGACAIGACAPRKSFIFYYVFDRLCFFDF